MLQYESEDRSDKPPQERGFSITTITMALTNIKLIRYLIEARHEMKKVVWPSRKETTNHTLLVVGVSLAVAAFLGIVDFFLNLGLEKIIR